MSNILGIIGSILIMPSLIIGASYLVYLIVILIKGIIKEIKQDLFNGLLLIALTMAIVGILLLAIAVCLS